MVRVYLGDSVVAMRGVHWNWLCCEPGLHLCCAWSDMLQLLGLRPPLHFSLPCPPVFRGGPLHQRLWVKACEWCIFAVSASSIAVADGGPISPSHELLQRKEPVLLFLDCPWSSSQLWQMRHLGKALSPSPLAAEIFVLWPSSPLGELPVKPVICLLGCNWQLFTSLLSHCYFLFCGAQFCRDIYFLQQY